MDLGFFTSGKLEGMERDNIDFLIKTSESRSLNLLGEFCLFFTSWFGSPPHLSLEMGNKQIFYWQFLEKKGRLLK